MKYKVKVKIELQRYEEGRGVSKDADEEGKFDCCVEVRMCSLFIKYLKQEGR